MEEDNAGAGAVAGEREKGRERGREKRKRSGERERSEAASGKKKKPQRKFRCSDCNFITPRHRSFGKLQSFSVIIIILTNFL